MHKKTIVFFFKMFLSLALVIVLSEGISFAANMGAPHSNSLQHFVASGKLPPGIQKEIGETGQAEILLILDDSDVRELARQMRQARNLKYDDAGVISEKARIYKQKKDSVLSRISPGNFKFLKDYDKFPIVYLEVDEDALGVLLNMDEVRYIGENKVVEPYLAESLPLISAPQAHLAGATGAGTSVAVLDTGVDYTLAAFGSCTAPGAPVGTCKVAYAQDFATEDNSLDDDGHGTNVSGIVVGVAPDTRVLGLDIFRTNGSAYYDDIISALNWVVANKTTYNTVAVNMSFGVDEYTGPCPSDALAVAISEIKTSGITTAAASGNNGYTNALGSPACAPEAISVGAVYDSNLGGINWSVCTDLTTAADMVTCFSNSSSFLTMLAPGAIIDAAGIAMGGTSQAAPHVSGAVAVAKGQDNSLTVDQVISRLTSTGVSVFDDRNNITKPRLDLYGLVTITNPIIGAAPTSLSFKGAEGGLDPADKSMSITNNGAGTLNWSVSSSETWLTLDPASGTGAGNVTLSVNTTGLSAGIYNAVITITAAGALNTPQTVPVTLEVINTAYSEDFELGNLTKFPWATGGSSAWTVQNSIKHTGNFAVKSPVMTDSQLSYLEVTLNVTSPGDISFWYKVSSEPRWDKLVFRIDGSIKGTWEGYSGEIDWSQETVSVTAGIHTFRWEYSKDGSVSQGSDAVWLDDIFFPPSNNLVPNPSVSPSTKDFGSVSVSGTSAAQSFTVSNTGTGNLIISTVSLTGSHGSQFTKENDACSGQTLSPSGTCTVDVRFTPSSTGSKGAILSISSNYPVAATAALSGTGTVSYTLTLNKTGSTGTGTVTSEPSGINCGADCTGPYNSGTAVILTAAPDANSTFAGWSGGGCSGTDSCAVTISSNTTVTAIFNMVPPTADFAGSPVSGDALLNVSFFDSSSNNPVSWSWTFGDGGTSTQQNPVHQYVNPGVFTVSLTATNAGGSDTLTKTDYINVSSLPLRISGAPPSYYSSITAAYGAAAGGDIIQEQAAVFPEDLNCNRNISVTLKGGYDSLFETNTGATTISGSLTISYGTVIIENISIQ